MSRVITVLTAEGSLEFVGTGDLDECLKSGRIQRRGLHDKIHRNFEKWNKVQLSGVENDSFFSDRSITVSVDHCSNGRESQKRILSDIRIWKKQGSAFS